MSVRTRASSPGGGGTTFLSGTLAARPVAGTANSYYYATDVFVLFRDTGAAWEKVGGMLYALYLHDVYAGSGLIDTAFAVNEAWFTPLQIMETVTIDRLISLGSFPMAGNIRIALYADNGGVPDGSALIVETASVAGVNGYSELAIANTRLAPGLYWIAQNRDDVTGAWFYYNHAAGGTLNGGRTVAMAYGAFPAVCPVTAQVNDALAFAVRVASIP